MEPSAAAVILAAGAAERFGGNKLEARLAGRPIVGHVLEAAVAAGLEPVFVVLGPETPGLVAIAEAAGARPILNPRPSDGLASSVRVGLAAVAALPDALGGAVILPGDQPRVSPSVIRTLLAVPAAVRAPLVAPRYPDDRAPNPVLVRREAFALAADLVGDRGFGPLIAARPDLVTWVDVPGDNPDVDTPADLAALVDAAWGDRVRANRDQVDRFREVPDGPDFYGPVTSLFRADPRRSGDAVVDALRALARPGETWLDVGAGGGRYALPLALAVAPGGSVLAVDPSPGMLETLRGQMLEHGVHNVRPVAGRWPPDENLAGELGPPPIADVALIAHVGYDVEAIGSFVAALERAARRLVVAVMMGRQPASLADPFWPPVHGEARVNLPALPEFLELLAARRVAPSLLEVEREPRRFDDRDQLLGFLRRQLWTEPGSVKDRRLAAELDARLERHPDGTVGLPDERGSIGIVTWRPPG